VAVVTLDRNCGPAKGFLKHPPFIAKMQKCKRTEQDREKYLINGSLAITTKQEGA